MTTVHTTHVRIDTNRHSLRSTPKVNGKRSLASRQNMLARNNLCVAVSLTMVRKMLEQFITKNTILPHPNIAYKNNDNAIILTRQADVALPFCNNKLTNEHN